MSERKIIKAQVQAASRAEQQQPVSPCQSCLSKNWVELVYKYNSCRAVSFASYKVYDAATDQCLATGKLDNMGFARVDGLPDSVTNVKFQFGSDPKRFEVFPEFKPQPHNLTPQTKEITEEDGTVVSVAKWVGGALAGDFIDDQSFGQIAFGTVVTLIPVVDQVGDVRDIVANLGYRIIYNKQHGEFSPWFGLITSIIGAIPEVGSLIKGICKELFSVVKAGSKKRVPLDKLIKLMNSVGEGNAVKFLRELLEKLPKYGEDAAQKIVDILDGMKTRLRALSILPFGKAKEVADDLLESISKIYSDKRVPRMVKEIIEWLTKHLKETLDGAKDFVEKGVTRTRNGAKQLKEKFIRASGDELRTIAEKAGMKPEHIERIAAHCRKNDRLVVVRVSNADSLKFQGKAGFLPKPLDVKLKTAKGEGVAEDIKGLVTKPKEPMKDWEKANIEELTKKGFDFDERGILRDKNGNAFHGDYDVQSFQRKVQMENPETKEMEDVYVNELTNPDDGVGAIDELNKDVVGDIPQAQHPFQHGAEGDYRVKTNQDGTIKKGPDGKSQTVTADQLNTGAGGKQMEAGKDYKLGKQPGDDEKYLVVTPDGEYRIVENPKELEKMYDEIGVPWEYDASPAIAPATAAAATGKN